MLYPQSSAEHPSKTIAALVGPALCAMGLSMLFNRAEMAVMVAQISNDYGLIFLSGVLLLIAGLAIVRVHNIWPRDWRSIVTAIGWLAVISGLIRILFFRQLAEMARQVLQWMALLPVASLVMLGLGAFLSLKAFR